MVELGRLKEIMERVFNLVLESSTIRVELELPYDKDQFKNCIDEARRTSEWKDGISIVIKVLLERYHNIGEMEK